MSKHKTWDNFFLFGAILYHFLYISNIYSTGLHYSRWLFTCKYYKLIYNYFLPIFFASFFVPFYTFILQTFSFLVDCLLVIVTSSSTTIALLWQSYSYLYYISNVSWRFEVTSYHSSEVSIRLRNQMILNF